MRCLLPALLVLVAARDLAAEPPDPAAFLNETLGPATVQAFSPEERENLLRHTGALLASPAGVPPVLTRCYAPDTPPLLLEAYQALEAAALAREPEPGAPLPAQQLIDRWTETATDGSGQGAQGLPITLTWSIVPDGTAIPGNSQVGDSNDPSELRAFLAGIYGGDPAGPPHLQPWFVHFTTVFDNISAQTGVSYVYEPADDGLTSPLTSAHPGQLGVRGDIRIGGHDIDGNGPTLAYNLFPDAGDMIIDTNDGWLDANKANPNAITNLIEHEHGHGLGLLHVCPLDSTKLMEPQIHTTFRGIRFDDLYSLQRHYGDFHEKQGSARNNDSVVNAAILPVTPGVPFASGWLSIDDGDDTDYFAINAEAGATISVRIIPSSEIYPEGGQTPRCSATTNFDSSTRQDLSLALLASDGTTTLATGPGTPAGETEEILSHIAASTGTHFIHVDDSGGSLDICQLYRLEVTVNPPGPELDLVAMQFAGESFRNQNGLPDPGETVRYELTFLNRGSLPADNAQVSLSGPAGFTGFSASQPLGSLSSGQTGVANLTFALERPCGDEVELTVTATADGGHERSYPLRVRLGTSTPFFNEAADASPTLPAGWSSSESGDGAPWEVVTTDSASAPRSFFTPNTFGDGSAALQSPAITLPAGPSVLSFSHSYLTELGFDGGVLEISINGGPWQDILTAGGTFTQRPYTTLLNDSPSNNNPLKGRQSWSGTSDGFVTTTLTLPTISQGQPVRLRWVLGCDNIINRTGWWIDDIVLSHPACDTSLPLLSLSSPDDSAAEFDPLDTATLTLTTPLPSLTPLPASLQNAGSADLTTDVSGAGALVLPAGQTSQDFTLAALPDALPEGPETLDLTLADGLGGAIITLIDAPYDQWAFTQMGSGPLTGPTDDFEGDGLLNIVEYAYQTDPGTPNPAPDLLPALTPSHFRVSAPLSGSPPDLLIGAEQSTNLLHWTPSGITRLPNGFEIPRQPAPLFLRLTYERLLQAP